MPDAASIVGLPYPHYLPVTESWRSSTTWPLYVIEFAHENIVGNRCRAPVR